MTQEIDWVFGLKLNVLEFLHEMSSPKKAGYYRHSYSGDLYDESKHWNVGSSAYALKIYYTLGLEKDQAVEDIGRYIKSFQKPNGLIYDDFIYRKAFLRNVAVSLKHWNLMNLFNEQYKRAETRQCYSSLMLYSMLPQKVCSLIPKTKKEIDSYLSRLNWKNPWQAGGVFSHLMFFLQLSKESGVTNNIDFDELISYAIDKVNKLQNSKDGGWYKGRVDDRLKVNGAMKVITGIAAVNKTYFSYPEKLIDLCLNASDYESACDNFNIIYVLNNASKLLNKSYRQDDIEQFALKKLAIYKNRYYRQQGGFSFFPSGANHNYYEAKITKGLNEPDMHGTVLFLWGISIIVQLLGIEKELEFKEFKA